MGGFCLLVELHRVGSAPAACAAGLLEYKVYIRAHNLMEPVAFFFGGGGRNNLLQMTFESPECKTTVFERQLV